MKVIARNKWPGDARDACENHVRVHDGRRVVHIEADEQWPLLDASDRPTLPRYKVVCEECEMPYHERRDRETIANMFSIPESKEIVVAVTGHRPNGLGASNPYSDQTYWKLESLAEDLIKRLAPVDRVYTGMALGWDQAVAQACLALGVKYVAAIPFHGQENKWLPQAQRRYNSLIESAAERVVVSKGGYSPNKMQLRNMFMVNKADVVLALYSGNRGGTQNTVNYTRKMRVPMLNAWQSWIDKYR